MQMDKLIPEKTKRKTLWFLDFKNLEVIEKSVERAHTTSISNDNSIRAIFRRRKV